MIEAYITIGFVLLTVTVVGIGELIAVKRGWLDNDGEESVK